MRSSTLLLLAGVQVTAFVTPAPRRVRYRCDVPRSTKDDDAITETPFAAAPELGILARAAVVGVATGTCVTAFKLSIDAVDTTAYNAYLSSVFSAGGAATASPLGSAAVYASIPALGGLGVGLLRCITPDFDRPPSNTTFAGALSQAAAAVATLGTGNSLGPEGPAVRLGATVAARASGTIRGDKYRGRIQKVLTGAGEAAGVAAGFSAPIAGIFYALEVSSRDDRSADGALVLPRAAVAATAVSSVLAALVVEQAGPSVQLRLPSPDYGGISLAALGLELPLYLGLGALCGLVALALQNAITYSEEVWNENGAIGSVVPERLRPAACGALAGALGVYCQPVLFNGYATLNSILQDQGGDAATLLTYTLLKIIATAAAVGAGLVGGLFAPSLFLGATAGSAYAQIASQLTELIGVDPNFLTTPACATVGAASVLAAVFRAPLTAAMLLFELTRDYDVVLPLVASAGVAALVVELNGRPR